MYDQQNKIHPGLFFVQINLWKSENVFSWHLKPVYSDSYIFNIS